MNGRASCMVMAKLGLLGAHHWSSAPDRKKLGTGKRLCCCLDLLLSGMQLAIVTCSLRHIPEVQLSRKETLANHQTAISSASVTPQTVQSVPACQIDILGS